jgi:hypothetical protein
MANRSLHAVTKVYYRSMSCFAMVSWVDTRYPDHACSAMVSRVDTRSHGPSCTMWGCAKYQGNPHSSEQDTQPIVFLITKWAAPYRTCGGTYSLRVSTPMIWSLADLSTTCHDGINNLHHSNHCSNHTIDPHMIKSHLDGWKTTTLLQRHMPNSTS